MSEKSDKLWKKDDYLKPVDSNDPMLMYDIEEDENQGNLLKGNDKKSGIPVWYTNKITIIDFTIYTWFFVVDGPILHSKSVVGRSILHCKAKNCVFSKI